MTNNALTGHCKKIQKKIQFETHKDKALQFSVFVAFCSFFPCSLTFFHRGRKQKSGGRQQKSSRAGQQNNFFIFQPDFNVQISPKNATKHPVA